MVKQNQIKRSASPLNATEVALCGEAFAPHRHDTYTIALTQSGVQSFNYRGALRHSLPGQVVVLHPDEMHDGQAGTEEGFSYRSINVAPRIVHDISGSVELPYIDGGITVDLEIKDALSTLCMEIDYSLDDLEREDALARIVFRLMALGSASKRRTKSVDIVSANKACRFIEENLFNPIDMEDVAVAAEKDRWQLSRSFKAVYGTSPYRFITKRRLDAALTMLAKGKNPSETALACAFYDQSHFTRHFKQAFGITPAKWKMLQA